MSSTKTIAKTQQGEAVAALGWQKKLRESDYGAYLTTENTFWGEFMYAMRFSGQALVTLPILTFIRGLLHRRASEFFSHPITAAACPCWLDPIVGQV
jgi:hypothetical protein